MPTILSQPELSTSSLVGTSTARTRNQRSLIPNAHPIEFGLDQSSGIQKCKSSLSRLSLPIPKANNKRRRRISGRARAKLGQIFANTGRRRGDRRSFGRRGKCVPLRDRTRGGESWEPCSVIEGTTRDCRWDGVGGYLPLSASSTIV